MKYVTSEKVLEERAAKAQEAADSAMVLAKKNPTKANISRAQEMQFLADRAEGRFLGCGLKVTMKGGVCVPN